MTLVLQIIDTPIWMAARASSAAPAYFKQFGKYIDGGMKANNPSMSALTRIHQYYSDCGKRNYKISCVVSLGCGKFTATSRENFTVYRAITLKAVGHLSQQVKILFDAFTAEVSNYLQSLALLTSQVFQTKFPQIATVT